jgi:hypothetical protein
MKSAESEEFLKFLEFDPFSRFARFARFAQRARTVSPPLIFAGPSFSDMKCRPALSTLDPPLSSVPFPDFKE